jgi:hypothetical protein
MTAKYAQNGFDKIANWTLTIATIIVSSTTIDRLRAIQSNRIDVIIV